jgi:hypothetical protein
VVRFGCALQETASKQTATVAPAIRPAAVTFRIVIIATPSNCQLSEHAAGPAFRSSSIPGTTKAVT